MGQRDDTTLTTVRPGSLDALRASMAQCRRCPLSLGRNHVVVGEGTSAPRFMIVGEGPGRDEDLSGRPFVGRSGRLLRSMLDDVWPGALERGDVYLTNTVKCRPPSNRTPLVSEIRTCSDYLRDEIELLAPRAIVTVGLTATRALLGLTAPLRELRGRSFAVGAVVVVPTYHPAAALRGGQAIVNLIESDLRSAFTLGSVGSGADIVGS